MRNFLLTSLCIYVLIVSALPPIKCGTSSSIPQLLQPCYRRNFSVISRPPMTMPVLIELIRKVELGEPNVNTRMLSSIILHELVFDGIQRTPNLFLDESLAIPYAATLNKFHKYKVIVDYLVAEQISLFPSQALTFDELCFLHQLISNTVNRFERGDEESTCEDYSLMPSESAALNNGASSSCPLKLGNIQTRWGPISISHLIAGIAAGLQQEQVTFERVFDAIYRNKGETNASYKLPSNTNRASQDIDNVLFATIAGDLGEVLLSQASENPVIGNQGYWNDTTLPRAFYLKSQHWDLTEAEILAGIDGAIIGKKASYLSNVVDTRLSQFLDMYYSDRGIPYGFNFKVTNRSISLNYLGENIDFANQIYGSSKLLQAIKGTYSVTLTDEYIQKLSRTHVGVYKETAGSIASNYDKIEYVTTSKLMSNLEVIVVLDGTFGSYSVQQMMYALSEAIDVSHYGSRLGIINGQTGAWITNMTRENFEIFQSLQQLDRLQTWPVTLSLGRSLQTVIGYYQNRSRIDCSTQVMDPIGQAVVVFSRDGRLTENDVTSSRRSIETIKQMYPQTVMIYVSPDVNGLFGELSQNDDDSLVNTSTNVFSTVTKIVEKLSVVPGSLIKFYCNHSNVRFEHYSTPGEENVFQIHREYVKRGYITTKFTNKDYGDLSICFFTSRTSRNNRVCHLVTVNSEISFNSGSLCSSDSICDLQYSLTANNSQIKCAEINCRYPDQVLLTITYQYSSGLRTLVNIFAIFSSILLLNIL